MCTRSETGITCKRIYIFLSSTGTTNFNDDRKYSSISLYNLATQFPPIVASRTQTSYTSVHSPPVTFGNPSMASDNPENYYAAADIVQVRKEKFESIRLLLSAKCSAREYP